MLLRRITKHVREQNWFAVALDFFIVVAGILIAFQITEWNEARTDRQIERNILERLQDQLAFVESTNTAVDDYGYQNTTILNSAREALFLESEKTDLSPEECNAIGYSNIILNVGDDVPILQELESTGRLEIITNQSVVNAIVNLSSAKKRENAIIAESRPFRIDLASRFPDLLSVEVTPDKESGAFEEIGSYDRTFSCNFENMLADRAFLNAAGSNISYSFGIFEIGTLPKRKATEDLIAAVNAALGLSDSVKSESDKHQDKKGDE